MSIKSSTVSTYEKMVIKTSEGYLGSVWEEWDSDIQNFDFTDNPKAAYPFYDKDDVPKYLGCYQNVKINNVEEAAEYLRGEIKKVIITTTVEWEEQECQ
ncbi:hypothetical protein [Bacillus paranthracis]|uniref:hypothetical protein n=1 Tax=Bacillus paranthracis TaxID=2026186 RepID=UPI0022E4353E|nr:hypothetical protein [Bacillus paranthracis]